MSGKITSLGQSTLQSYDQTITHCRDLFLKKNADYGTSWRVLRISSILDQIFIKANRIKTLEENGFQNKINEGVVPEYIGIINYSVIALIQIQLGSSDKLFDEHQLSTLFDDWTAKTRQLMLDKNHDYGEAWRSMQVSTFTDMILMRILRMRQIMENDGKTKISEGLESNLQDMINYAIFALIRIEES